MLPPKSFHTVLLDGEVGLPSPEAKVVREDNLHILSTWSYYQAKRTATFCLWEDVLQIMLARDEWVVDIWQTNSWTPRGGPTPVQEVRAAGRTRA